MLVISLYCSGNLKIIWIECELQKIENNLAQSLQLSMHSFEKQTLNYDLEKFNYLLVMLGQLPSVEGVHSILGGSSLPHAKTWPLRNSSA